MKKFMLFITTLLFASSLLAITVDTTAKYDTAYDYEGGPISVSTSFGKIPNPGDYGIFANMKYKVEKGEDSSNFFFRVDGAEIVKEGKYLYLLIDGSKIKLAKKKWYGWKKVDGVNIKYSIKKGTYPTIKVWLEI